MRRGGGVMRVEESRGRGEGVAQGGRSGVEGRREEGEGGNEWRGGEGVEWRGRRKRRVGEREGVERSGGKEWRRCTIPLVLKAQCQLDIKMSITCSHPVHWIKVT